MKKRFITISLLFVGFISFYKSQAQTQQPTQPAKNFFDAYPGIMIFDQAEVQRSFNFKKGDKADIAISPSFKISGVVLANENKYNQIQQIIIASALQENTTIQVTKISQPGEPVKYAGHIINKGHADGYRLIQNEKGEYVFKKYALKDVMEVCTSPN